MRACSARTSPCKPLSASGLADPLAPADSQPLTEGQWRTALCLDSVPTVHLGPAQVQSLTEWTAGVVTLFTDRTDDLAPQLSRVLNLATFLDRMELPFLLDSGLPGVRVLRAHRLEDGGHLTPWRWEGHTPPPTLRLSGRLSITPSAESKG